MRVDRKERFLVIRLSALGDLVLTTPIVEYLSRKGEVDVLTYSHFWEIFKNDPRVHRVWSIRRRNLDGILDVLKEQDYSLVVDLQVKPITLFIGRLLKVKTLRINKHSLRRRLYAWFGIKPNIGRIWENYLGQVSDFFGEKSPNIKPRIYPPEVGFTFELPERYVVVSPEASTKLKRWDFNRYLELSRALKGYGYEVVWIGRESYPEVDVGIDLRGKTDISQMINVIKNARALVGNDSAPIHIAYALNVPSIAILGPTTRELGFVDHRVVERDLKCRTCSTNGSGRCLLGKVRCLDIDVQTVLSSLLLEMKSS